MRVSNSLNYQRKPLPNPDTKAHHRIAPTTYMQRGLMSEPRVLLIDEPSLGLAPVIVQEIFSIIEALKAEGKTIVLVEQNTHLAVKAADHVYLMQSGKVVLSQAAREVELDKLHDLYFARQASAEGHF